MRVVLVQPPLADAHLRLPPVEPVRQVALARQGEPVQPGARARLAKPLQPVAAEQPHL
ncbi:MAG: hypothetical protein RL701_4005 [Pseudomonadota bacterium]|jgi:hypothetical protein